MIERSYTVESLKKYIKDVIDSDMGLMSVVVRGEVSGVTYAASGHAYFSIKDPTGTIPCVMFKGRMYQGLNFVLKNGQEVLVHGKVEVYERDTKLQIIAHKIEQSGIGAIAAQLEALRAELDALGYFDEAHKKSLPKYPKTIGVVTSESGAAIGDISNTIKERNPSVQLILYSALVQGVGAAESIAKGIKHLDKMGLDVIIVGRGGGSYEELLAFNERVVAEAIYNAKTPIISAVGHERDHLISDNVADRACKTPTQAAQEAVLLRSDILASLADYKDRFDHKMTVVLEQKKYILTNYESKLEAASPMRKLETRMQELDGVRDRLDRIMNSKIADVKNRLQRYDVLDLKMQRVIEAKKSNLALYAGKLDGVSPLKRLSAGYSYVEGPDGENLRSIEEIKNGDSISITLADGVADANVTNVRKK